MSNMRATRVTGKGLIKVHPDMTRITMTLEGMYPKAVKNKLLGKAVTDAREKAAVLTEAAGTTLKDIQTIDYSWGEINFEFHPMNRNLMLEECEAMPSGAGSYDMDIEPDDIEVSDTVTVIWEIA